VAFIVLFIESGKWNCCYFDHPSYHHHYDHPQPNSLSSPVSPLLPQWNYCQCHHYYHHDYYSLKPTHHIFWINVSLTNILMTTGCDIPKIWWTELAILKAQLIKSRYITPHANHLLLFLHVCITSKSFPNKCYPLWCPKSFAS
jgi:hypothetical protein